MIPHNRTSCIDSNVQPLRSSTDPLVDSLATSLWRLYKWLTEDRWKGLDPYDIHAWGNTRGRGLDNVLSRRLRYWVEHIAQHYPRMVRRLLRIKGSLYPEAFGLLGNAYGIIYATFGRDDSLALARKCATWLQRHRSPGFPGPAWGLPFDWQSRILIPAGTPCVTTTVECGRAFLSLYGATGNGDYLQMCVDICEALLVGLNIDRIAPNAVCFSYTPLDRFHVHNANLLCAGFLATIAREADRPTFLDVAAEAANYALREQRPDGSLSYWGCDQGGDLFRNDHYHCCFEMRGLHWVWKATADERYRKALERYHQYYRHNFIGPDGAPYRNPCDNSIIDIKGCAEAHSCNAQLLDDIPEAKSVLCSVAKWTVRHMQVSDGYFAFRMLGNRLIDVPYIRWGQAPMLHGLASALPALK